jgi:hypothetical protein
MNAHIVNAGSTSSSRAAKSVAPIEQAAKFVLQIVRARVPKP